MMSRPPYRRFPKKGLYTVAIDDTKARQIALILIYILDSMDLLRVARDHSQIHDLDPTTVELDKIITAMANEASRLNSGKEAAEYEIDGQASTAH